MKNVTIPRKELKDKRLLVQVTATEHKTIMQFCKNQKITLAYLIRFAIKQTVGL
jgi:hypothetical protein